jgi:uncharacterized membrane protein
MYIKIKGIFIRVILLVQLAVLLLGYGFLGYYLPLLYRGGRLVEALILCGLSLAATWAVTFNLGGLIAIAFTSMISLFYGGLVNCLLATGAAALFLFFCLWGDDYEEPDRKEQNLNRLDWLLAMIPIAFVALFSLLVVSKAPNIWFSHLLAGGVAGAIATVGLQTKSINLTKSKSFLLLGGLAVVGLAIGGLFDLIIVSRSFRDFI